MNYILYSHIDPDHTMGMRVIEQMRLDWLKDSVGISCDNPIQIISLPKVIKNLKFQGTKYGSALDYYESKGLVKIVGKNQIDIGKISIKFVPANEKGTVTIFVITDGVSKIIYAPCDIKPFPKNNLFQEADCLIIGNTIVGERLKDGFILEKDNPLRVELFVMEEIISLKKKYNINKIIITHLEEDWGKSYSDYLELQKQYDGIEFAYDGMEI